MLKNILLVGLGGAIGAMLRYGVTILGAAIGWSSHLSTFLVNTVGSLAMGFILGCCSESGWLLLATAGICGGFTTFSAFSMQSVVLIEQGKWGPALLYILGTLITCVLLAGLGFYIGQKFK